MIGLFDSGSGGLSVLTAIRKRAPAADIVYFGDIKNAPYGERSSQELAALTKDGITKLMGMGALEIVSACNSVSLSVLKGFTGHDRVIEMTRPTARMMRKCAGARMLLLATLATVASRIYRDALEVMVQLDELPIAHLAHAIDRDEPPSVIREILRTAFESRRGKTYDGIILACTHYPLIREHIADVAKDFFGVIEIIDPAEAVAEDVAQRFTITGSGNTQYCISQDSVAFRRRVAGLFPYTENAIQVI